MHAKRQPHLSRESPSEALHPQEFLALVGRRAPYLIDRRFPEGGFANRGFVTKKIKGMDMGVGMHETIIYLKAISGSPENQVSEVL
jgi:hypothetical protein